MATYTCPRCGEEHEEDEDPNFTIEDGCSECDHWSQCDHCGKWIDSMATVSTSDGDEEWCASCVDNAATTCDHCGAAVADDCTEEVARDGDSEYWCVTCVRRYSWVCTDCGTRYSDQDDAYATSDGDICSLCVDRYEFCEECDNHFNNTRECDCGNTKSGIFRVAGYGCHGSFKILNNWGTKKHSPPPIGLEMEVGDFPSASSRRDFGEKIFVQLGDDFAYPTADGSLGEYGIEFIGHPIGAIDHIADYDRYSKFFDGLAEYGATVENNPSGCHMNFGKEFFVSEEAIRCAIIACVRFYDALILFTDPERREARATYCKKADLFSGKDPIEQCRGNGKYSIVNIKNHDGAHGIVEFRLAGMCLDLNRHLAQIQLYHNLVAWANKNHENKESASYAPFDEIFLPILFQESIEDVIDLGMKTGSLPLGDPAPDSRAVSAPYQLGELQGAIGYVLEMDGFVASGPAHNSVYDADFRARPGDIVMISHERSTLVIASRNCHVRIGGVSIFPPESLSAAGYFGPIRWRRNVGAIRYFFEDDTYVTFPILEARQQDQDYQALLPTTFEG